jgi:hypothetical protein
MKKLIAVALLIFIITNVNAQTEKQDWMVGGSIRLNTSKNNTEVAFEPTAGIFVINNLAVGANLLIDYSKTGNTKVTNFGMGPFARYYFTEANVRPMFHGSITYLGNKVKVPGNSSSNTGVNFFIGGGMAIFLGDQASLDILAGYDFTKYKDFHGSGGFSLTIGFQVYLLKRQMDRLRGK